MTLIPIYSYIILYLTLVPGSFISAQITTLSELDDKFANLFDVYFDKQAVIPVQMIGSAIAITVNFDLVSVVGFEDDTGSAVISGYLTVTWMEERFTTVADDINIIVSASSIWTPPLLIVNSLSSTAVVGSVDDIVRFNLNSAQVIWKPRIYTKVKCDSNAFFPFDKQECSLKISSVNLEYTDMTITVTQNTVGTTLYIANGIWELMKSSASSYNVLSYPYADFKLTILRKAQYLTFIIVSPIIVISTVHLFVFLLPQHTDRSNYGITSMLCVLIVILWTTSYVPLNTQPVSVIVYYLFIEFLLNVIVLMISLEIFKIFSRKAVSCFKSLVTKKNMPETKGKDDVIRPKTTLDPATARGVRISSIASAWDDEEFEESSQAPDSSSIRSIDKEDHSKFTTTPIYVFILFICLHFLFTVAFFVSLGINLE